MAKDINLLEQVFERSWNYYDEQLSKILNEAVTIFKWMEEVIPATEEALDRKTACSLPKTPHIKRRKIDEHQQEQADEECVCSASVDNRESEIVEAKLPRPLRPRRNAKTSNRRSSKGIHSKHYQKKAQSQTIKPGRVTRASQKKSILEKEVSTNVDGTLECTDLHETTQSNTTKSFIEHEKDMLCVDEINEKDNVAIDEIVFKCLAVKLDDQLHFDDTDGDSIKPDNPDSSAAKDEESAGKNTSEHIDKKQPLMSNNDAEHPMVSNQLTQSKTEMQKNNDIIEDVIYNAENSQEVLFEKENEKCSSDPKIACDDRIEKPSDDVADCKTEIQENNNGMTKKFNSASSICQQGQVAKIKERLFEKITLPSSSTPTRQSPRLIAARQSPKLTRNAFRIETPKRLNSPITKQKLEEHFVFDFEMEDTLKQSQGYETGTEQDDKRGNVVENVKNGTEIEHLSNSPGPAIIKPLKPKNLLTGVHSMIKAANQKNNVIHQGPVTKQGNVVSGLYSFIKPKAVEKKPETVQERKQRLEDEAKKKDEARNKLIQQAEHRRQKEIEERKKRRQEREQRVAEAQAKKAQEEKEKQEQAQKRFEMMKRNEEKLRKLKEKEEEMKKKMREKKMAEAEAKRRQEENDRITKIVEKEEEEKRKADYLQRKQEYEEMERRKKIEDQKKAEELRQEEHAKDKQLQEERLRREIKEREAQVRKRLEEKERELKEMHEKRKIEKEKQEKEDEEKLRREEQERLKRDEEERFRKEKQEIIRMEEQERLKKEQQDRLRKELQEKSKAEKERLEQELWRLKKEKEVKENERKLREIKELKERKEKQRKEELKAEKKNEINEREAYHHKKLEQKQFGEAKRTFDKAELDMKQSSMRSPMHPAPHSGQQNVQKVQCTTYNTPTLKTTSKKKKSLSLQNYDINSLSEDDSTDDEEDPAQVIPTWANGTNIKRAISAQIQSGIDPHEIFVDMLEPPKLERMFPKLRARFFKRTSSACWDHPPRPFKTMLY